LSQQATELFFPNVQQGLENVAFIDLDVDLMLEEKQLGLQLREAESGQITAFLELLKDGVQGQRAGDLLCSLRSLVLLVLAGIKNLSDLAEYRQDVLLLPMDF